MPNTYKTFKELTEFKFKKIINRENVFFSSFSFVCNLILIQVSFSTAEVDGVLLETLTDGVSTNPPKKSLSLSSSQLYSLLLADFSL